jgi:hypothetical protein
MKYLIHFCRYHDGLDRNQFHRESFEIEAENDRNVLGHDGDKNVIDQVEERLITRPDIEYVQICDISNNCRWSKWIGQNWELGAAHPHFFEWCKEQRKKTLQEN